MPFLVDKAHLLATMAPIVLAMKSNLEVNVVVVMLVGNGLVSSWIMHRGITVSLLIARDIRHTNTLADTAATAGNNHLAIAWK